MTISSHCFALIIALVVIVSAQVAAPAGQAQTQFAASRPASIAEVIAAGTDLWGDAALCQVDGPSYEFFAGLLPPLKYVNAEFRYYPIVLSAPQSPWKSRLISNGSGVNLPAKKPPMWSDFGRPIRFCAGTPGELFGSDCTRTKGPRLLGGYLPVVGMDYRCGQALYHQEVFAPVETGCARFGAVMVRFTCEGSSVGRVEARFEPGTLLTVRDGMVLNEQGQTLARFSPVWQWQSAARTLAAEIGPEDSAELLILAQPSPSSFPAVTPLLYEQRRTECIQKWTDILSQGTQLTVPEVVVEQAWRATVINNFVIADGDRMNYSAGNAYAKLYQAECGDSLRSLLLFGHRSTARAMLRPLMEFHREATRYHVAGHKLQLLAYYYWITRDAEAVRANQDTWQPVVESMISGREPETGLLPKDNYAGDIAEQVYSLNSNANSWRGLRDMAAVLEEMGCAEEARPLRDHADQYRKAILAAIAKSERLNTEPPFIPMALLSDEPAHDPLTATRTGSYYDLMAPYVLGAEIFGHDDPREDWLLSYLQQHGGICMGMLRTQPHQGEFNGHHGVVPLYGLRYSLTLLRRDEWERALVGFYGQLAQGMTRDTYMGGEGARFVHGDSAGRTMYLPPNSTNNATFLLTLRHLLIQDWDLDRDGKPDTLRLLHALPRRWLVDGAAISIHDAPTMFGKLSMDVRSALSSGEVTVRVTAPPHQPRSTRLRVSLPSGWRVTGAAVDGIELAMAPDRSVEIADRKGECVVTFKVADDQE